MEARIANLEGAFMQISGRLNGIDSRLDGIDRRLGGFDLRFQETHKKIDNLQWCMTALIFTSWVTLMFAVLLHR